MSEVRWSRRAQADLITIDDYLAAIDPDLANTVGKAALTASAFLGEHPHAGSRVHADVRKWRVASSRYLLLYRVEPSGVLILRVRHDSEDWVPS
ncbi:type II toxin-antitoxin system RelE/ParE family toxin [Sphingomonas prati]|uniref:Plasmid stabilization system protein ParE n=1 Tax=Sphingomonas prati TaxID=1843237 RepID=A0A7W9F237_9SPHN|nr:type II toxin-antitoxin system RelE/ParE family toxin [Sphingomonas prati]MBB5729963.1 plasmid stabilization system protein ParE [Sphingomonas prati]GGE88158.1 hypothetical protein GCM10011404_21220 [Sphingomonas prati]